MQSLSVMQCIQNTTPMQVAMSPVTFHPMRKGLSLLPEKMMSGRCQKPSASLTFDTSPNKLKMNKTSESISEWIV